MPLRRWPGHTGQWAPGSTGRRDIQGLRALAVIAVFLDHLVDWPAGGFVGVDVFFVVSGYIITRVLLREYERTGTISYTGFYIRRVKRVVPAAVAVLFVTVVCSWPLAGLQRTITTSHDAIWALLFAANWRFEAQGTDYFYEGQRPSPLQHYWSLGVEEQFYLVWPWLMLLLLVAGSRHLGASRRTDRAVAAVAIGVLSAASLAWAAAQSAADPTSAYFSSFTRAWEIGLGALIAIVAPLCRRLPRPARVPLAWVGLTGIGISVFVVKETTGFPVPWAALPVVATGLVIVAGEADDGARAPCLLTHKVSNFVGDISYSLYLWHFPVLILLQSVMVAGSIAYVVTSTVLVAGLSLASFFLLEDPVRRSDWLTGASSPHPPLHRVRSFLTTRQVTTGGISVLAVLALAASAVALQTPEPPATSINELRAAARQAGSARVPCLGADAIEKATTCQPLPDQAVYPPPTELASDKEASYACFTKYREAVPQVCRYGTRARARVEIALVGDSHAATLIPGLATAADRRGWAIDSYVGQGCVWGEPNGCPAMKRIEQALVQKRYDVVVTSSYRGQNSGIDDEVAVDHLVEAWSRIQRAGSKIVVVADNPAVGRRAMQCISRTNVGPRSKCSTPLAEATALPDRLTLAAREMTEVPVVDLQRYFCRGSVCPAIIGHVLVYRDELSHVSDTYSETLGPYVARALAAAIRS